MVTERTAARTAAIQKEWQGSTGPVRELVSTTFEFGNSSTRKVKKIIEQSNKEAKEVVTSIHTDQKVILPGEEGEKSVVLTLHYRGEQPTSLGALLGRSTADDTLIVQITDAPEGDIGLADSIGIFDLATGQLRYARIADVEAQADNHGINNTNDPNLRKTQLVDVAILAPALQALTFGPAPISPVSTPVA